MNEKIGQCRISVTWYIYIERFCVLKLHLVKKVGDSSVVRQHDTLWVVRRLYETVNLSVEEHYLCDSVRHTRNITTICVSLFVSIFG